LRRSSLKTRYRDTGPSKDAVELVLFRAGFQCEVCSVGLSGIRGVDYHIHHRRARRMGGSQWEGINLCSNLLALDRFCHQDIESRRAHALETGRLVPSSADPAYVAVLVQDHWKYLRADGSTSLHPPMEVA
jgi:5-methylcytosine-specific restriction enzyme A